MHMGPSHAALTWHSGLSNDFTGSFLVDEKAYRLFVLRPKGTLKVIFPYGYIKIWKQKGQPQSLPFSFLTVRNKVRVKKFVTKDKGTNITYKVRFAQSRTEIREWALRVDQKTRVVVF